MSAQACLRETRYVGSFPGVWVVGVCLTGGSGEAEDLARFLFRFIKSREREC